MPGHDIIVVGTSAGGVEALQILVGGLPCYLLAEIFIVLHVAPTSPSFLDEILTRAGPLPATQGVDGELITPGRIYVAPPDHYLLLEAGHVRVTRGPKENRFRPALDGLFRSATYAYGPRVIGVILTGALDDGTAGLWAVKDRGGLAVVQAPLDALHTSMPQSALRHVAVDYCMPLAKLAPILVRLATEPAPTEGGFPVSKCWPLKHRLRGEITGSMRAFWRWAHSRPLPVRSVTGCWCSSRTETSPAFAAIPAMRIRRAVSSRR
jgi:two-component system, chemotaxis family, protein-glutamate methylesterase/glutaminase